MKKMCKLSSLFLCVVFLLLAMRVQAEPTHVERTLTAGDMEIHINAEFPIPHIAELPMGVIREMRWAEDKIISTLFADRVDDVMISAPDEEMFSISLDDGSYFDFTLTGKATYHGPYYLRTYANPEFWLDGFSASEAIDMSEADARKVAEETLISLGVTDYVYSSTYPISFSVLQQSESMNEDDSVQHRTVEKADEGYYFKYSICFNNIPYISHIRYSFYDDYEVYGSEVEIVVTGRGVQYFSTSAGNTLYELVSTGESKKIASIDQVLDALVNVYSEIIVLEPVEIDKITFCYVPVPMSGGSIRQYELRPAWVFYDLQYDEDTGMILDDSDPLCIIDAHTLETIE